MFIYYSTHFNTQFYSQFNLYLSTVLFINLYLFQFINCQIQTRFKKKSFLNYNIYQMANQSAKKNQQRIKTPVLVLTYAVYGGTAWFILWNIYYLLSQQVSIIHFLLCLGVSYLNHYCLKTIVKYWQLQASEAAEYHIDVLAMNLFVTFLDFWTHNVWHVYWFILVFILSFVGKWLWSYITPKYQQTQEQQGTDGKKQKKEKRQKIKYIKR